jgi:hypothetical protein
VCRCPDLRIQQRQQKQGRVLLWLGLQRPSHLAVNPSNQACNLMSNQQRLVMQHPLTTLLEHIPQPVLIHAPHTHAHTKGSHTRARSSLAESDVIPPRLAVSKPPTLRLHCFAADGQHTCCQAQDTPWSATAPLLRWLVS